MRGFESFDTCRWPNGLSSTPRWLKSCGVIGRIVLDLAWIHGISRLGFNVDVLLEYEREFSVQSRYIVKCTLGDANCKKKRTANRNPYENSTNPQEILVQYFLIP